MLMNDEGDETGYTVVLLPARLYALVFSSIKQFVLYFLLQFHLIPFAMPPFSFFYMACSAVVGKDLSLDNKSGVYSIFR